MQPQEPHHQSGMPTDLPPVAAQAPLPLSLAQQQVPTAQAAVPTASAQQPGDVVQLARQLSEQYRGNPYQLSQNLQQLKAAYVSQKFGIQVKSEEK